MTTLFPTASPPEPAKADVLIAEYIALRDGKKAAEEAYKTWVEQNYNRRMGEIEVKLMEQLHAAGVDSFKTKEGTAFKRTETSVTVADGGQFQRFVIGSNLWELIDFRANKTAVKSFLEEHKSLPPGLNHSETFVVSVRRPS